MKNSDRSVRGFAGEAAYRLGEVPVLPEPLRALLREHRMLHAVLLEGKSAPERRDMALALAGAILCREEGEAMCKKCPACRKVLTASHPDLIFLDPAADPDCYKKQSLKDLRIEAWQRPVEAAARVVIFLDAHLITAECQNIFLSMIEEPPGDTYFILCLPNRYRLLPTVLSRVVSFALPTFSDEECLAKLWELAPGHTEDEYAKALIRAGGSPSTGVLLLEDAPTGKRFAAAEEMMAGLATSGVYRVLAAAQPFERDRAGYQALLETLGDLLENPTLQKVYQMRPKAARAARGEVTALLGLTERNAYLPLVTALLTERVLHRA